MIYTFRSEKRNCDVGDKIRFRNFMFATSDEDLAALARRNCEANPNEYFETTGLGKDSFPPAVKTITGIRTSEVQEMGRELSAPPPVKKRLGRPPKVKQEGVTAQ